MDDNGAEDEKIIAIPFDDPTYNSYKSISQLPPHIFEEMRHFFKVYKQLENDKYTEISEARGPDEAKEVIAACLDRYLNDFCKA